MPITVSGAQFKAFYADPHFWPEDGETFHDDVLFEIDGERTADMDTDKLSDTAKVSVVYGGGVMGLGNDMGLDEYLEKWLKTQTTTLLSVEVPNEKLDAVKAALEALGCTVRA